MSVKSRAAKSRENRRKDLRKKYGITPAEYDRMFEMQRGLCLICHKPWPRRLSVDHDHVTGKIRGLLCNNCNTGLGYFKDSADRLVSAALYLEDKR